MYRGIAASKGIAVGTAFVLPTEDDYSLAPANNFAKTEDIAGETLRIEAAIAQVADEKTELLAVIDGEQVEIFEAHIEILHDKKLLNDVLARIRTEKEPAETAFSKTIDSYCTMFEAIDDEYIKERATDFRDVATSVMKALSGETENRFADMPDNCIVVAHDLAPSETVYLDKGKVLGFATDIGSRTSHTAIIAGSLGIPAVLGMNDITKNAKDGDTLIVDGIEGLVIVNPSHDELASYRIKQAKYCEERDGLKQLKDLPSITKCGRRRVKLCVNIGGVKDCEQGIQNGAEGVGLFRSELLYMDRETLPSEDEQFEAYKDVVETMSPKSVIIRTLDIGGDKELPYLDIPHEMNPFLGNRAIRLCLEQKDLFLSQLRAILRASHYGKTRIMFPMISGLPELRAAIDVLDTAKKELRNECVPFDSEIEIGIMIEIPSAAIIADRLIDHVDFFSIGSNDLVQYTLAVDRMNQSLNGLYKPLHPAVLRLIKNVIDASHKAGKWTGMCGEMAGEAKYIPLLLGLGLDEFSMGAGALLPVKKIIRNLDYEEVRRIADKALELSEAEDVSALLGKYINEI